ncbi:TrbI/VirB10 family protein [Paraburkholderia fungorum]|uniref:TrbI/VirB10 family protein n=1 Tax=Paraburkholderia fungorum TaxID=134537 RepID=UPI00402BE980
MAFGLVAVGGFLLFSIMSMDSGDKPTAATEDPDAAAEKKAQSVEPATPNLRGIGDGQVGVLAQASDAVGAGAAPSIPVGASGGAVTVPPVGSGSAVPVGGNGAVQLTNAHNAGPQGEQYQTPEEAAAARRKQALIDAHTKAINASMEMGGGEGGMGSLGSAGVGGIVPAIGGNNQLNNALTAAAQAAQAAAAGGAGPSPIGAYGQPQDDQNKQVRKEGFLKASQSAPDNDVLRELVKPALSPFQLMAGTIIPGALECGLNSDLPGQTCARVTENVFDSATGQYLLIPQGTKLLGTYDSQVAYGQERTLVVWNRLIFPDGSSINIQGMPGEDNAGNAGFDANVNNHYAKVFGGALLMAAFSSGISLSQKQSTGSYGTLSNQQTITQSVGQQLGQTGQQYIQKGMNIQPTLTNAPGYRFKIVATKDIVFPGAYVPHPATVQ